MSARSRVGGVRIWAAVAALYALVLHVPWMAGVPATMPSVASISAHAHGSPADHAPATHAGPDLCCVVCGAGPCAVGPLSTGSVAVAALRSRKQRRRARRLRAPNPTFTRSYEARGPPSAV